MSSTSHHAGIEVTALRRHRGAMSHATGHVIGVAVAAIGLLVAVPRAAAQTRTSTAARVVERAIRLLPARPDVPVRLVDPELAPEPDAIRPLDAFLVRGRDGRPRRVIYLNSRSA